LGAFSGFYYLSQRIITIFMIDKSLKYNMFL
jgi:hypothetical protein